jgi:hypothetical protein
VKATKATVRDLCRRKGYELGEARRGLATEWVIGVYHEYEGRRVPGYVARDFKLADVYGDLATWLRARPDVGGCE